MDVHLWGVVIGQQRWGEALRRLSGVSTAAYDAVHGREHGPRGGQAAVYLDDGTLFWRSGIARRRDGSCSRGSRPRGWSYAWCGRSAAGRRDAATGYAVLCRLAASAETLEVNVVPFNELAWLGRYAISGIGHLVLLGHPGYRLQDPTTQLWRVGMDRVTAQFPIPTRARLESLGIRVECPEPDGGPNGEFVVFPRAHNILREFGGMGGMAFTG